MITVKDNQTMASYQIHDILGMTKLLLYSFV